MVGEQDTASRTPGVHYARRDDGVELPIIDLTHAAFAMEVTEDEVRSRVQQFLAEPQPLAKMPAFLRDAVLRLLLGRSMLASGIRRAQGAYLDAMSTYLMKLAPEHLVPPYATRIDRRIAAAFPAFTIRLRLHDMARLLAEALRGRLASSSRAPLRLINIAGGTAIDSINALLLLRKDGLLSGRRVVIEVLDRDAEGPAFVVRVIEALRAPGAPLHGTEVLLHHTLYDWNSPTVLGQRLAGGESAIVGSSEGGLFEYGSDEAIVSNLQRLAENSGPEFVMVGSVTRADEPIQRLRRMPHVAVKPRGLAVFRALVERAGWRVASVIERPFSDHVALAKA